MLYTYLHHTTNSYINIFKLIDDMQIYLSYQKLILKIIKSIDLFYSNNFMKIKFFIY